MRRTRKLTAPPLSVAVVVAALVTLGAATAITYAVMTDDTTLTITSARVFAWAWLVLMVLGVIDRTGKKLHTLRGRR